uniref:Uncharacterized protein n=1 Tax=Anguilla anguilla TaxID=7936 RepID=A0A0E9WBA8_ANGAN
MSSSKSFTVPERCPASRVWTLLLCKHVL